MQATKGWWHRDETSVYLKIRGIANTHLLFVCGGVLVSGAFARRTHTLALRSTPSPGGSPRWRAGGVDVLSRALESGRITSYAVDASLGTPSPRRVDAIPDAGLRLRHPGQVRRRRPGPQPRAHDGVGALRQGGRQLRSRLRRGRRGHRRLTKELLTRVVSIAARPPRKPLEVETRFFPASVRE